MNSAGGSAVAGPHKHAASKRPWLPFVKKLPTASNLAPLEPRGSAGAGPTLSTIKCSRQRGNPPLFSSFCSGSFLQLAIEHVDKAVGHVNEAGIMSNHQYGRSGLVQFPQHLHNGLAVG